MESSFVKQKQILGDDHDVEKLRGIALAVFGEHADLDFGSSKYELQDDITLGTSRKKKSGENESVDLSLPEVTSNKRKPAWVDQNAAKIKVSDAAMKMSKYRGNQHVKEVSSKVYEDTLRQKFTTVHGSQQDWADLDMKIDLSDDDNNDIDDITMKTTTYLKGRSSSATLPKSSLEFKKLNDLNRGSYQEGKIIKSVEFNPNCNSTPIALVAGVTNDSFGSATIFQVDGVNNHKIHSMKFEKFPIKCAQFTQDGTKFIAGSNLYGHFFIHDIQSSNTMKIPWNKSQDRRNMKKFQVSPDGKVVVFAGNNGKLHLYDVTSFSYIESFQTPSQINDISFNVDGSIMYTHGDNGEVYIWDMHARQCTNKFFDEGCIKGTAIAASPNGKYIACGSSSGIVNIYDVNDLSKTKLVPLKCLANLTTMVTDLNFNSSSEVLSMTSNCTNNAIKLVHFPSMTVFNNFPIMKKDFKRCQLVRFSPNNGFMSIGNNSGCAYLFRLKHYKSF